MMKKSRTCAIACVFVSVLLLGFRDRSLRFDALPSEAPAPPGACDAAWSAAADLINRLTAATTSDTDVWVGYGLDDATYVIYAGESTEGEACLGVWQGGKALADTMLAVKPNISTPLYGIHYSWKGNGGPFDPLLEISEQPPEIRTWLIEHGVNNAVILPAHVEDFPIAVSPSLQVQVALHEAFHVHVQAPRWLGPGGDWPVWDLQPDRAAMSACYEAGTSVESLFEDERRALERFITALLDDDRPDACQAGEQFLSRRTARYEMLRDVRVAGNDDVSRSCPDAEAIMELEEGGADFASWSMLYYMGHVSRDELMNRYRARQDDVFYLTGAMQLHALYLMNPEEFIATTEEIAQSQTPQEGSLTRVLARSLASYCR